MAEVTKVADVGAEIERVARAMWANACKRHFKRDGADKPFDAEPEEVRNDFLAYARVAVRAVVGAEATMGEEQCR